MRVASRVANSLLSCVTKSENSPIYDVRLAVVELNRFLSLLLCTAKNYILTSAHFPQVMINANSITIIFSPYHVGLRDYRVGDGPTRIRALGVVKELEKLGVMVHILKLLLVKDFEREIGRSFKLLRRTSKAVTDVYAKQSFPLVLL